MSDLFKVYSPEELQGLDEEKKARLRQELEQQVRDSEEIRAIIKLYSDMNERLKGKLSNTLNQLRSE
jgi:hypothetical protein